MFGIEIGEKTLTKIEIVKFYLFNGDLRLLHFLGILMLLDIITGLAKAWYKKNLWSRKSLFGFARKLGVFCIIVLANIIDQILELDGMLIMITMMFYIANEGLSIVENCAEIGILVPRGLAEKLAVILSENEKQTVTAELKKELSLDNGTLPGDKVDVSVRVEPEKIRDLKDGPSFAGPERWS